MKRIQDQEKGPCEKKVEAKPVAPVVAPVQVKTTTVAPVKRPTAGRQVSEDDEIARIKRENKAAGSSTTTEADRPAERQSILKKTTPSVEETATEVSQVSVDQPCLNSLGLVIEPLCSNLFLDSFIHCFLCLIFKPRRPDHRL